MLGRLGVNPSTATPTRPKLLVLLGAGALVLLAAACTGEKGDSGPAGPQGQRGSDGLPCTVTDAGGGMKTISCPGGVTVTVRDGEAGAAGRDGAPGAAGTSCTVTDDGLGTKTISCTDGTTATVVDGTDGTHGADGTDGTPCSVVDNGDGTKTITCGDGTSVTLADGADGSDGTNGADGEDGISCTAVSNTDGSKTVSCTDGTSVTLAPPLPDRVDPRDDLPGLVVEILEVTGATHSDGTFAAGDHLVVTFTVETAGGLPVNVEELDSAEIWVAGPTSNYQHVIPQTRDQATISDVLSAAVQNVDGSYTYVFDAPIPAEFGVPLNDTAKFTDGELSGPLVPGTYTVALRLYKSYQVGADTIPDVGADTAVFSFDHANAIELREVVTTANCNQCHAVLQVHGATYRSTELCATCHTAGAEDDGSTDLDDPTPETIDFRVMIHKLHNARRLPSVLGVSTNPDGTRSYAATPRPYVVGGHDYSNTAFPVFPNFSIALPRDQGHSSLTSGQKSLEDNIRRGVTACDKCHGDPDRDGPLEAPADGARWYTAPTRAACGSCHDDIVWSQPYVANGVSMPAQADDSLCAPCHQPSGGPLTIVDGHRHPLHDPGLNPEISIAITSLSGGSGANGSFIAGDRPSLTFSVADSDGVEVPVALLDSMSTTLLGPTSNRQVVFPYATPSGISLNPFDFTGRLAAISTTGKGTMSKVFPADGTQSETLVVELSSPTSFTVTGRASGLLGGGTFTAGASTNPSGSSVANFSVTQSAVAQPVTIAFSSAQDFTVSGASGSLGTGRLSAAVSGNTRFTSTDGTLSFNLSVGTTAFSPGNNLYLYVFKGPVANPVSFVLVAGRTAFAAADRFYYDYVAPAPSYTIPLPMDLPLETIGAADGSLGQVFTAANLPVAFGRQTVYERTAMVGTPTALASAAVMMTKDVAVASLSGLASNDYVVLDAGTADEEHLQISRVDTALGRIYFRTPLRFGHLEGAQLQEVTLTFRREGVDYLLEPTAGTITLVNAATPGNAWVMSYRTEARFGWYRRLGDVLQTVYATPLNDSPLLDESWGDWGGKPYVAGTYTVGIWGYQNIELARQGELQTYRGTSPSALLDFNYGGATVIEPYSPISSGDKCQACHDDLSFHGGGRLGPDVCFLCHGIAGGEAGPGETVSFRTLIHELHEADFPAMPGGAKNCTMCHGTSDNWRSPPDRSHPTAQGVAVRAWTVVCSGCHASRSATAHFDVMTAPSGDESCASCHGPGRDLEVGVVHKTH